MRVKSNRFQLILLGAVLFGIYCFVFGQSGILERMRLAKEKEMLVREISFLESENTRIRDLRDRYVRGDFLRDEFESAGYIVPGNRRLFFDEKEKPAINSSPAVKAAEKGFSIEKMRIAWVCFSVIVIGLFLYFRREALRNTFGGLKSREFIDED